jgi:hypothetical protein
MKVCAGALKTHEKDKNSVRKVISVLLWEVRYLLDLRDEMTNRSISAAYFQNTDNMWFRRHLLKRK